MIVTLNRDGSFKLVESRVISASGLAAAGIGVSAAVLAGFMGARSMFQGAKSEVGAARARSGHVDVEAEKVRALLGESGSSGAVLIVRTADQPTAEIVEARAAERATDHWRGPSADLLATLDRLGRDYDWLRPAVGEPPQKKR
jgi:hypothetical protein